MKKVLEHQIKVDGCVCVCQCVDVGLIWLKAWNGSLPAVAPFCGLNWEMFFKIHHGEIEGAV
jgi:hypothetical protein